MVVGGDAPPHDEELNAQHSERMKGRRWFNNGRRCVMAYDCPEGFVKGRIGWVCVKLRVGHRVGHMGGRKKGFTMSAETKKKISMSLKGRPHTEAQKHNGAANRGWKWWNDGIRNIRAIECPEGYTKGQFKTLRKRTTNQEDRI